MLCVKSFDFRPCYGADIASFDKSVNDKIRSLKERGINEVEFKISTLDKFLVYTLIWHEGE